jgi:hypothetical protein
MRPSYTNNDVSGNGERVLDYIRDAAEIYRQSFATIRAEADLSRFPDDVARVVVRLIHTCGQVDVAEHVAFSDDVVGKTHAALVAGAPVLCDSSMVAAGITKSRLPADNEVVSLVADPRAADLADRTGTTGRWWPSATRPPRCSGCWSSSTTAPRPRPRCLAAPSGSSVRRSQNRS